MLVERAPNLNGYIEGNVQFNRGESFNLNSGGEIVGILLVPGTPNIQVNKNARGGEVLEGGGAATPSGYHLKINNGAAVDALTTRVDPLSLSPAVSPVAPTGARHVNINTPSEDPGDFRAIRNLNANSGAGSVAVPPGAYGAFTANQGAVFELGVPGAAVPAVYSFERLQLNGAAQLALVGPVVINLSHGFASGGSIGSPSNPEWLSLNIENGGLNLNGGGRFYGRLKAPNGHVNINSNALLVGSL